MGLQEDTATITRPDASSGRPAARGGCGIWAQAPVKASAILLVAIAILAVVAANVANLVLARSYGTRARAGRAHRARRITRPPDRADHRRGAGSDADVPPLAALIERVRTTVTDGNGQYRVLALPAGMDEIRFSQQGFSTRQRERIIVSSGTAETVSLELLRAGEPLQTVVIGCPG